MRRTMLLAVAVLSTGVACGDGDPELNQPRITPAEASSGESAVAAAEPAGPRAPSSAGASAATTDGYMPARNVHRPPTSPAGSGAQAPSSPTPASSEPGASRTAPYDFGCAIDMPCAEQYEEARNGRLRAVRSGRPCVGYSMPPAPRACGWDVHSAAGVALGRLERRGEVQMSAVVRRDPSLPAHQLHACLAVLDRTNGHGAYEVGCAELPANGTVTIQGAVDTSQWTANDASVWVALQGEGAAFVERITYAVVD